MKEYKIIGNELIEKIRRDCNFESDELLKNIDCLGKYKEALKKELEFHDKQHGICDFLLEIDIPKTYHNYFDYKSVLKETTINFDKDDEDEYSEIDLYSYKLYYAIEDVKDYHKSSCIFIDKEIKEVDGQIKSLVSPEPKPAA